MADDLEVTGNEQFVRLAKKLNAQGKAGRGLWKELNAGLNDAVAPMTQQVRSKLRTYLPDNYANVLYRVLQVRVSRSTRGTGPGLKLVGTAKGRAKRRRISTIDQGTLRHPVYRMGTWVDQQVKPGFWREPLSDAREIPAREIRRAVQRTIKKIT